MRCITVMTTNTKAYVAPPAARQPAKFAPAAAAPTIAAQRAYESPIRVGAAGACPVKHPAASAASEDAEPGEHAPPGPAETA